MMRRVLITGGAGFIGNNLSRRLRAGGVEVIALDDLSLGRADNLPKDVPLIRGDVAEEECWRDVPAVDGVVHLAGASSAPMFPNRLANCFQNNIVGFVRVLEYARAAGAKRVVYASTSSVYGNITPPLREEGPVDVPNFYAASKYCMEQIAQTYSRQYGLDVVGFRFMSVYGPREDHKKQYANLVSQFIWDIEQGHAPTVYGDGSQTRDFTNVADVAAALTLALNHAAPLGSSIFNVGGRRETSVNQMVELLSEAMGRKVIPRYIPNPVVQGYVQHQFADLARIGSVLGYQPRVSLRDGIQEILALRGRAPVPSSTRGTSGTTISSAAAIGAGSLANGCE
jgi:UDP-glucose 4-epimerase